MFSSLCPQVILVKWNEPYQKLASCDSTGVIFVWIKYDGRWSIELINDRSTPVTHFSWSHDGRMALICYKVGGDRSDIGCGLFAFCRGWAFLPFRSNTLDPYVNMHNKCTYCKYVYKFNIVLHQVLSELSINPLRPSGSSKLRSTVFCI